MFEKLDQVDWASLNHAYGSAEDVPAMLRDLASDDEGVREDAFFNAYGNIFHQGTRYEATAPAIPFLLELLNQPGYPDTEEVLTLIAHLVMGYSEAYVPFGYAQHIASMRMELEQQRTRPAEERAQDEADELGWGTDEDWLRWMVNITDEARRGVPRYIRLLGADEPDTRIAAAFLLSWLPEDLELFGPALWTTATEDEDDAVRANALIALALACDGAAFEEYVSETEAMLADGEPIVQFAAAIALGSRVTDCDDAVIQVLLDGVARAGSDDPDDEEESEDWPFAWCDGDYGAYAGEVLSLVCADEPSRVVNAIAAAMPGMTTTQAYSGAAVVLSLIFPDGFDEETQKLDDLDDMQRGFLHTLAELRNPWFYGDTAFGNFTLLMGDFGFPTSMEKLQAFLTA